MSRIASLFIWNVHHQEQATREVVPDGRLARLVLAARIDQAKQWIEEHLSGLFGMTRHVVSGVKPRVE